MFIGDLAAATGLSVDTLRYYEKIGLIPRPLRDAGGRRVYDMDTLRWVDFLKRLKATGMGISGMLTYARLRAKGDQTSAPRRLMLEERRRLVRSQIHDLTECLEILDGKIDTYLAIEAGLDASRATDGQQTDPTDDESSAGIAQGRGNERRASTRRPKPLRARLAAP